MYFGKDGRWYPYKETPKQYRDRKHRDYITSRGWYGRKKSASGGYFWQALAVLALLWWIFS
jgi:hypothetical protein